MDAQELKPGSSRGVRPRVVRLLVAWLAVLLAVGLWQAYGVWLSSGAWAHVR